jgi:hypothetical protein
MHHWRRGEVAKAHNVQARNNSRNGVSIPLIVKSSVFASVSTKAVSKPTVAPVTAKRRKASCRITTAPASAAAPITRKTQSAASSDEFPVSKLAAAGSRTPNGEVNEWTRSPAVKVNPWPVARFLEARYVI